MISPEERAVYEQDRIEERRQKLYSDLEKVEPLIKRLNRSIEALEYSDRVITEERFINGKRSGKVLEQIATMMFGPSVIPVQTHFVFFDEWKKS